MSRGEESERSGPGWLVTLLGASVLLLAGFAVGVVVGAVREEPGLILNHLSGGTQSVSPAPQAAPQSAAPVPAPAPTTPVVSPAPPAAAQPSAPAPPAAAANVATAAAPTARAAAARGVGDAEPPLGREGRAVAPPAVASQPPATGGRFFIQVGAFADSVQAEKLAGDLRKKGFAVAIAPGTGDRASRWRVRVGPLASRADADHAAERLRSREKLPTWTLDESR